MPEKAINSKFLVTTRQY